MADDISKRTLFVLLVLTVILSLLGTWQVLSTQPSGISNTVASGEVRFGVLGDGGGQQVIPVATEASGEVTFGVLK